MQRLVESERIARAAGQLLRADGVRLYHDAAFFKEPNDHQTVWHTDQVPPAAAVSCDCRGVVLFSGWLMVGGFFFANVAPLIIVVHVVSCLEAGTLVEVVGPVI